MADSPTAGFGQAGAAGMQRIIIIDTPSSAKTERKETDKEVTNTPARVHFAATDTPPTWAAPHTNHHRHRRRRRRLVDGALWPSLVSLLALQRPLLLLV